MTNWTVHTKETDVKHTILTRSKFCHKLHSSDVIKRTSQLFSNNDPNAKISSMYLKLRHECHDGVNRTGFKFKFFHHTFNFSKSYPSKVEFTKGLKIIIKAKNRKILKELIKKLWHLSLSKQIRFGKFPPANAKNNNEVKILVPKIDASVAVFFVLNQLSPFSDAVAKATADWVFREEEVSARKDYTEAISLSSEIILEKKQMNKQSMG